MKNSTSLKLGKNERSFSFVNAVSSLVAYRLKAFSPTCEKAFVAIVSVSIIKPYPESRALLDIIEHWRILILI